MSAILGGLDASLTHANQSPGCVPHRGHYLQGKNFSDPRRPWPSGVFLCFCGARASPYFA
jgi:hypothetical protein